MGGERLVGGVGDGVSEFFTMNPKISFFFWEGGGGGRVSEDSLQRIRI